MATVPRIRYFCAGFLLLSCVKAASAWTNTAKYYSDVNPLGSPFGYMEFLPTLYGINLTDSFPIVVFLHGYGERGNGNTELTKVNANGPPAMIVNNAAYNKNATFFDSYNCIVLSPQTSSGSWSPTAVDSFLTFVLSQYRVDAHRIYFTGLSMGGQGVWDYSFSVGKNKAAAIVPLCGMQGSSSNGTLLGFDVPCWTFHGTSDTGPTDFDLTVARTSSMARFIHGDGTTYSSFTDSGFNRTLVTNTGYYTNAVGWKWRSGVNAPQGSENPAFTAYQGAGHNIWVTAYNTAAMWTWFFAQTRSTLAPVLNPTRSNIYVASGSTEVVSITMSSTKLTYVLANVGIGNLTITSVSLSNLINCNASVSTQPGTTAIPGKSVSPSLAITVKVISSLLAWSLQVSVQSNDPSTNPYTWTTKGYAATGVYTSAFYNSTTVGDGPVIRTDAPIAVAYNWNTGSPGGNVTKDNFSARWTGYALPTATGNYTFSTIVDDGARLWVDGVLLIDQWGGHPATEWTGIASLIAGVKVRIQLDYLEFTGSASISLMWETAGVFKHAIPAASGPELDVTRNGTSLLSGGTDFVSGVTTIGVSSTFTYLFSNTGTATLNIVTPVSVSSVSNCAVVVNTQPASTVAAAGKTNLVLSFTPIAPGAYSFSVSVSSNDANENPYSWTVSGTAAAPNTAPTISVLTDQNIAFGVVVGPLAVTVGDAETPDSLTLSATSSNTVLLPSTGIVLGGSGANRLITLTPASGQSGTSTVTVTVSDGFLATSATFQIVWAIPALRRIVIDVDGDGSAGTNNLGLSAAVANAVDSDGATTGIRFAVTTPFSGINSLGVVSNALYPGTAQQTAFYVNIAATVNHGDITISGLNTAATYDVVLFGSRTAAATADRTSIYTINGVSLSLNAANNVNNTVQFSGLSPAVDGTIVVITTAASTSPFGYLNVLELLVHST